MLHTLLLLAEGEQQPAPWFSSPIMLLPLVVVLFYFLILRPGRRQEAERQSLLSSMKKNDKVLTTAGIYGTIVSVAEKEDEIVVKIDDNCRVKVVKPPTMPNLTN